MASEATHLTLGGTVLAVAGWLVKHLQVRHHKEEPPSVREWHRSQADIQEAIEGMKSSTARLERVLSEADLPWIKRTQAAHGLEIDALRNGHERMRNDIIDLKRDSEDRDERIDRLAKRLGHLGD